AKVAQRLRQHDEQHCAEHDAGYVPHAPQHYHAQDRDRFGKRKAFGADETLETGEETTGDAAETCAHGEGEQLDIARVDAHGRRGHLVLTYRYPGAAYARVLEAHRDEHDAEREGEKQIVIVVDGGKTQAQRGMRLRERICADPDGIDQVDSLRTVGDINRCIEIDEKDPDYFSEAQGDYGEIVSAQTQCRRAEQDAE